MSFRRILVIFENTIYSLFNFAENSTEIQMAKLKIYGDIVDNEEKTWLWFWGQDGVSYTDVADFIASMDEKDNEIDIRIYCRGGNCLEGWAIYDALRQSGKTIKATIEGECSSMATVILLAAPKERRYAFRNSSLCAHYPAAAMLPIPYTEERLTADLLRKQAKQLEDYAGVLDDETKRILDLYVERTGTDRATLEALMAQDKYINMDTALELGFIGSILPEITDIKAIRKFISINKKAKKMKVIQIAEDKAQKICALFGVEKLEDLQDYKIVDQVITDASGNELTVEREEGDPQVGDKAHPDGTYTMDDGTVITVADGVITEIKDPDETGGEGGGETGGDLSLDQAKAKLADLQSQIDDLNAQLNARKDDIAAKDTKITQLTSQVEALKKSQMTDEQKAILAVVDKAGGKDWLDQVTKMRSTFTPQNRRFTAHRNPGDPAPEGETAVQRKIREKKERYAAAKNGNASKA